MKAKRIVSALMSAAMALSLCNLSFAGAANDKITYTFDNGQGSFSNISYYGQVTGDPNMNYDDSQEVKGAIKFEQKNGNSSGAGIKINNVPLEAGNTYKITAKVYGENVTDGAYVSISNNEGYLPYMQYAPGFMNDSGTYNYNNHKPLDPGQITYIEKDKWVETVGYMAARPTDNYIKIRFPVGASMADGVTHDTYYIDDVTVEKIDSKTYFDLFTAGPKTQTDKTSGLKNAFAALDVSNTKNLLKVGETTPVNAYVQSCKDGANFVADTTKLNDLVREAVNSADVTAVSDNNAVASYENGIITANGVGTATITFSHTDAAGKTSSQAMTFAVVPQDAKSFDFAEDTTSLKIPVQDPVDDNVTVNVYPGELAKRNKIQTEIDASQPYVISYRSFNALSTLGRTKSGMQMLKFGFGGNEFQSGSGTWADGRFYAEDLIVGVNEDGTNKKITFNMNFGNKLVSGWNNLVIVGSAPKEHSVSDGYRVITVYLNGAKIGEQEYKFKNQDNNNVLLYANGSPIISDLKISTMKDKLKVSEILPLNNAEISIYDSASVTFNAAADITDGAIYITDESGNMLENVTVTATGTKATLKPENGFAPSSSFKLMLDESKVFEAGTTTALGTEIKTLTSFTTMSKEESDKVRITFDTADSNKFAAMNTQYAAVTYSDSVDYNGNGGGSVMYKLNDVEYVPAWSSTPLTNQSAGVNITIPTEYALKDKTAYKVTAQVYGEKVKAANPTALTVNEQLAAYATISKFNDYEYIGFYQYANGYSNNVNGTLHNSSWKWNDERTYRYYVSDDSKPEDFTYLKEGDWTEVTGYIVGKNTSNISVRFPVGTPGYDTYYIDNITISEVGTEEYLALFPKLAERYSFEAERDRSFSTLDVQKTNAVLTVGETSDLKAYIQTIAADATTGKPAISAADVSKITGKSDNSSIASYANGIITAKGVGQTTITFTYSDNGVTVSQKLLITVHPGNENAYSLDSADTMYFETNDVLYNDNRVWFTAGKNNGKYDTNVSWAEPFTVSFKTYYAGAYQSNKDLRNIGGISLYQGTTGTAISFNGTAFGNIELASDTKTFDSSSLVAGWNKIDLNFSAPTLNKEDGKYYTTMSVYVNGEFVDDVEKVMKNWNDELKEFNNGTTSYGDKVGMLLKLGMYVDDFNILQMPSQGEVVTDKFEIASVTVKADGDVITESSKLNGTKVTAELTLKNGLDKEQNYLVITGIYDSTDRLIDIVFNNGTLASGATSDTITTGALDMRSYTNGNYKLKIFVWDSFDNAYPLVTNVNEPLQ